MNQSISTMRAHLIRYAKENILAWYDLEDIEKGEPRTAPIQYLLDNDRFTCPEDAYEVRFFLFAQSAE